MISSWNSPKNKTDLVPVGSCWEYAQWYHRSGNFVVKRLIPADRTSGKIGSVDLYEVQETVHGDIRKYTEEDVIQIATLTKIQPGQTYLDGSNRVVKIARPEISAWPSPSWFFSVNGVQDQYSVRQSVILTSWTLVVMSGPTCPLCGGPGQSMITTFECKNSACRNYRKP